MPVATRLARCLVRPAALIVCVALLLATGLLQPAAAQAGLASITTSGSTDPDTRSCALLWQVTALLPGHASAAPQLRLGLRFHSRGRSQTVLHLPAGWAGLGETSAGPQLQALPGEATRRLVQHAPDEMVQLQWQWLPAADASQGGSVQLMPSWFAFSGQGVLPMPEGADEPGAGPACILLDGLDPGSRWASSHGTADGARALLTLGPSALPLAQRVQQALYAGGALQLQAAAGVLAVLPGDAPWPFGAAALAQAGAQALADQQRHWPTPAALDGATPPWLLLALPAAAATTPTTAGLASAWQQALLLQLPTAWVGAGPQLQALLTQALAHAWTAERFGPLAHAGRGDAALRTWFSEGWAEFLAHRSLLRDGLWTADDYAAALNARIAAYLAAPASQLPNADLVAAAARTPQLAVLPAMRGEWLALQWHQALRRNGQPGLEAVLRQLLVAPAQARREGPISQPLATHRVVAALRTVLQDQPLRDLQQHIDQGRPFVFGPDSLGPCFQPVAAAERGAVPAYQPVAGALQQADCQGWLGLGPLATAAGPLPRQAAATARGSAKKPVRKAGAKAGGRTSARSTNKTVGKSTSKAGSSKAKPSSPPRSGKPAR